jgi:hypothetical protein
MMDKLLHWLSRRNQRRVNAAVLAEWDKQRPALGRWMWR